MSDEKPKGPRVMALDELMKELIGQPTRTREGREKVVPMDLELLMPFINNNWEPSIGDIVEIAEFELARDRYNWPKPGWQCVVTGYAQDLVEECDQYVGDFVNITLIFKHIHPDGTWCFAHQPFDSRYFRRVGNVFDGDVPIPSEPEEPTPT